MSAGIHGDLARKPPRDGREVDRLHRLRLPCAAFQPFCGVSFSSQGRRSGSAQGLSSVRRTAVAKRAPTKGYRYAANPGQIRAANATTPSAARWTGSARLDGSADRFPRWQVFNLSSRMGRPGRRRATESAEILSADRHRDRALKPHIVDRFARPSRLCTLPRYFAAPESQSAPAIRSRRMEYEPSCAIDRRRVWKGQSTGARRP